MKLIFKAASAFLLLVWTSVAVYAQTGNTDTSWEAAKKQAVSEHKLIFIDLYFTGCVPCAQMEKEIFPDPKITTLLNANFVTFKSDIMNEEIGKKLSMKYGATGFPTFLLMNPDGKIIDITTGFKSVNELTALLQNSMESAKKGLFKKYSPTIQEKDYPEFYVQAYLANKRNVPFEVVDAYLKTQPSLAAEVPFVIITGLRVGRQYDDLFLANASQLAKDYGKSSVTNHILTILQRKKKELEKTNDLASFKKLLTDAKLFYTSEEWTRYEAILLKDFGVSKVSNN